MSQITSGIRAILSYPLIYDALQNIMDAKGTRRDFVTKFVRPDSGNRILDIGCGTAEILPYLPNDIEYWGYDISQRYIDVARARFGERARFNCKMLDQDELSRLPKFDIVIASGVLHHLDDLIASELFELARKALGKGGRMITIDPCLTPKQNPIARYLILHDRGQNVRDAAGYQSLAAKSFGSVRGTLRNRNGIPYTDWIMESSE